MSGDWSATPGVRLWNSNLPCQLKESVFIGAL